MLMQTLRPMLVLGVVCLALAACAPRAQRGTPAEPAAATASWNSYLAYSEAQKARVAPYRLKASLRYANGGDGHRVEVLVWSNGNAPLRLDIMAGIGVTAAKLREDSDNFLAYVPNESRAYYHLGEQKALLSFGVPVPFSVSDLAALLQGRMAEVFGSGHQPDATLVPDGGIAYSLQRGKAEGILEVSPEGLPTRWREQKEGGWNMVISYDDATPPLPRKFTITHGKGHQAILLVKDREAPAPFEPVQLGLELPPDTAVLPLRELKRNQ